MMLRNDVELVMSKTLTGTQLLIGIKQKNSFMKVPQKYINKFLELVKKIEIETIETQYDEVETKFIEQLAVLGYLDNGIEPRMSFNEFDKMGKTIWSKDIENISGLEVKNTKRFMAIFYSIMILGLGFIAYHYQYALIKIDYKEFRIESVLICVLVLPVVVLIIHEIGHYLTAQFLGVRTSKIKVGLFIVYPLAMVQYAGLPLYSLGKKVCVLLGGIFTHIINAVLGILLAMSLPQESQILNVWIVGNISMIMTNLILTTISDGYYLACQLSGIMNFRLKAYQSIKNIIKEKTLPKSHYEKVYTIIILTIFVSSFINTYLSIIYMVSVFSIPSLLAMVLAAVACLYLIIYLGIKIYKA